MKILIVGASGTIGAFVASALAERHQIVKAGSKSGDVRVDIKDSGSIRKMFEFVGKLDAVVSTAGKVHFGAFAEMTEAEFAIGLKDKLMGQVNLVLIGRHFVNDGGSFTLTSGVLSHDPIRLGAGASMTNGAIEFLRARRRHRAAARPAHQCDQPRRARGIAALLRPLLPRPRRGAGQQSRQRLRQIGRGRADRASLQRAVAHTLRIENRFSAGAASSRAARAACV